MSLFEFDKAYRDKFGLICGVDEAGRGPLAGDVYAAAVVFDEKVAIDGLNDSKKLSAKKREKLFDEIIEKARAYSIATASVEEIENLNILNATFLAMKRAVDGLAFDLGLVLVDGNKKPSLQYPVETVIKGDSLSASIAAASILAKVSRDRYMKTLAEKYPQYEFSKHKGYGTARHRELILKYGPCEIHRKSFLKKLFKNG
ncbi:MAG: ribonuclease HII [Oscillospiraceae bacterium]|nr:ribonuclease HII [Oscillospiraceae bacterium]